MHVFIDFDAETVLPLISKAGEFINILQSEIVSLPEN